MKKIITLLTTLSLSSFATQFSIVSCAKVEIPTFSGNINADLSKWNPEIASIPLNFYDIVNPVPISDPTSTTSNSIDDNNNHSVEPEEYINVFNALGSYIANSLFPKVMSSIFLNSTDFLTYWNNLSTKPSFVLYRDKNAVQQITDITDVVSIDGGLSDSGTWFVGVASFKLSSIYVKVNNVEDDILTINTSNKLELAVNQDGIKFDVGSVTPNFRNQLVVNANYQVWAKNEELVMDNNFAFPSDYKTEQSSQPELYVLRQYFFKAIESSLKQTYFILPLIDSSKLQKGSLATMLEMIYENNYSQSNYDILKNLVISLSTADKTKFGDAINAFNAKFDSSDATNYDPNYSILGLIFKMESE